MIATGEGGISCIECGYEIKVRTVTDRDSLEEALDWGKGGDPACPECGKWVIFEDYVYEQ